MTRFDETSGKFFNTGAHMLWIGERTRHVNEAHVEYFRGIANPVGVKLGPTANPDDVLALCKALNPEKSWGRVTLITRMGLRGVEETLPKLIDRIEDADCRVLWSVDPMHAHTQRTSNNIKTRNFDTILAEVEATYETHKRLGSYLGGVHFELTGDNVTECIGGSEGIAEEDLSRNYDTYCDPRLNYSQSLEMAFKIADLIREDFV